MAEKLGQSGHLFVLMSCSVKVEASLSTDGKMMMVCGLSSTSGNSFDFEGSSDTPVKHFSFLLERIKDTLIRCTFVNKIFIVRQSPVQLNHFYNSGSVVRKHMADGSCDHAVADSGLFCQNKTFGISVDKRSGWIS